MKKPVIFLAIFFMASMVWSQGLETFNNSSATGTYADGSFTGDNGFVWNYYHSRNEATYPIDGNGLMLRRADEPSMLSATISGGIGNFSVDTRKAFTGNAQRRLELVINTVVVAQFEPAFGEGENATVIPFVVDNINIPGDIEFVLRLYGTTGNQQIILDNLSWTGYGNGGEDTTPPTLVSAIAQTATTVRLVFSEPVVTVAATNAQNYSISSLTVTSVTMDGLSAVVIETSEQTENANYTITVNNVQDLAGNTIATNSAIQFTGFEQPEVIEVKVFFSEYIEGSSNNKALEIYNNNGSTINLSAFRIAQANNGGGWTYWHTFPVGTTLAHGDVWVMTTDTANTTLQNAADEILAYPSVVHHNGNDARALEYSSDGGANWEIIDIIGTPNNDPGDGWAVAGIPSATKDKTLVRKPNVTTGTTDWNASAGTNADDSQWIVYPVDTFTYIGYHQLAGEDVNPPTLTNAVAQSSTSVRLAFNEPVSAITAANSTHYTISGLSVINVTMDGLSAVVIETSEQTESANYTITVNNVQDLAGNTITANSQIQFTGYSGPVYHQIATIRANYSQYAGQTVTVKAIVTIGVNSIQTGRTNTYIQDNSGRGIAVFDYNVINTLQRGNEVIVVGTVGQYQGTMQIQSPQVTVVSTNNPEPNPLTFNLNNISQIELEGTLLKATGTIYEVYSAGGGTNLNIEDEAGKRMTVRVWDTTGINLTDYVVGFNLTAIGVGSVYNNVLQLVTGYQDQLKEASLNDHDDIYFEPTEPIANAEISVFYTPSITYSEVYFNWKKNNQLSFEPVLMDSIYIDNVIMYKTIIPPQPEGTIINYFLKSYKENGEIDCIPENAPYEFFQIKIPITSFKAILQIAPKPFNPFAGEKIDVTIGSTTSNKAILRIYNAEGKLVHTPYNDFINTASGTRTIQWNGRDKDNKQLPIGLYIAYLEVYQSGSSSKKTAKAPIVIGVPLK
jgi:hypothetical protein